jgi:lysophospholipase L1-like esterase
MSVKNVRLYVALGDSISIDDYPERETGTPGIGAASLFARELRAQFPDLVFDNLTADGATTDDVQRWQLARVRETADPAIVTLTAGGNDLLLNLRALRPPVKLVEGILTRLERILDEVRRRLPDSVILLGTVYDPTDGTNVLDGESLEREAKWLARLNEGIRAMAADRDGVRLTDIHARFLGHGLSVPQARRWYWDKLIFEPNAEGARQVAQLWLEAVTIVPVGAQF